jgi:hypothetical protein
MFENHDEMMIMADLYRVNTLSWNFIMIAH